MNNGQSNHSQPDGEGNTKELLPAETHTHRRFSAVLPVRLQSIATKEQFPNRQTEIFYLQKQIQSQTPMVIILEDGERIEGCIEWYDGDALKVRGRGKVLIYKSSIKYMYKQSESSR